MSRWSRPHGERELWQPWWLKASCLWTWNHMVPRFPLTRALPVSALSSGSLTVSGRQKAADLGDGKATEAPTATRCHTQHDTQRLVLMNTPSTRYAPHVPESTSLCLFIHYLLCSPNKVWFVRGTGKGVCRGSEWRQCLRQQKCWRWRVMGPPTGWQI